MPGNFEILHIIEKYYGSFFIMGSVNLAGIEKALEFEGLETNQTNINKILIYINNSMMQQAKEKDKNNGS